MTRYDPVLFDDTTRIVAVENLRQTAEELASILDRYPCRESSHAKTLLEGAVMFGVRAISIAEKGGKSDSKSPL